MGDGDECVFAGQPSHKFVASAPTPTINATRCSASSNRVQTCVASRLESGRGVETGVEQFALGNSALGDFKFASTLVESISNSTIISGVSLFDCVDESLPR